MLLDQSSKNPLWQPPIDEPIAGPSGTQSLISNSDGDDDGDDNAPLATTKIPRRKQAKGDVKTTEDICCSASVCFKYGRIT